MVLGLLFGIFYLFWDFFYWAKWAASLVVLRLRKYSKPRRFDLYDFQLKNVPEKMGILVPKEEIALESPFPEEHLQNGAADEIFMYGVNSKSEALLVRIARSCNDESEAWIYLKLADGRWYEKEQTSGFQRNFGGKCASFTCDGLQMYHLNAMRRWRIVYCGMLRERKNDDRQESKSVFVKFTFIWTASSDVYDAYSDFDVRTTADAMAKAKWNSPFPPEDNLTESFNFYAQSGVITGIVSIEEEPEIEMYLFGDRRRFIGKSAQLAGCKFKNIIGVVPETGLVVHVGKATIPNIFHNLHYGFTVEPNSLISIVEGGHIVSNFSDKKISATFKAGRKYDLHGKFLDEGIDFMKDKGWNGHLKLVGIEFEVDGCKGWGFLISGGVSEMPEWKIQRIPPSITSKLKPLTVFFSDDACHLTELTGGKGSSLGKLTKMRNEVKTLEFAVPNGIVVTTEAYEHFLSRDIKDKIENLKNIAYGNTKGNIQETCKLVSSAIERAYLPDKITKEIEEKLNRLFDGNINQHKVAVRSSATGEDTDQMSAAGQMDTFLGVQGLKEILTAVKKCWASQFGYIATEYKRRNGQILNSPMAVVIQEMVECEAAGVLFTCDPVTNNPSVAVITGNYGLGESVVSGSEEPDTVVLQKLSKDEVKIKTVLVGLKQHKIVMTDAKPSEEEDGTVTQDVSEEEKNRCCISEEMALKLGKLSLQIENYFKSPRDIEWGIKQNSIYILQSRPITTGGAVSDYEIKHEFDAPLRCEKELICVSNVGEVMPGAMSPLGLDVIRKNFCIVFTGLMAEKQRNTFGQSKYYPSGLPAPFYNHVMMTVADLVLRGADVDSVDAKAWMIGIFGRLLDEEEYNLSSLLKHRKYPPLKKSLKYYVTFWMDLFFSGRGNDALKEKVFNYQIPAESGRTAKEIFHLLQHSCSHISEPFLTHINVTEMSSLWNMHMMSVLGKENGSIDSTVYSDFAKLLASSSNVESADVPAAMQDLANSIAKVIKGKDFKAMSIEEAQEWLETSTNLAGYKYRQFLKRHGHRCLKEFDVHSLPWKTDPKPLIKILQSMAGSFEDVKENTEAELSDILPQLSIKLNLKSRLLLRFILPNCRRGVREREVCKSTFMKSVDNTRTGYRHLSKAMVAEGYLPDTDLMFFMTIDEISEMLETRNPRLIARANHRRKLLPQLDALLFPEIMRGRPVPINENTEQKDIDYEADLTMKGIPVSQGVVKAYARVAMSLEEASHLKKGEILITYSTDIGWSPYFPILAGVVTELGGLISHGAVVSREYGLPCVVGLHGATRQFVTGDYVLLDGNKGILQRLTPPES